MCFKLFLQVMLAGAMLGVLVGLVIVEVLTR